MPCNVSVFLNHLARSRRVLLLIRLRVLDHEQIAARQSLVDHFLAFAFADTWVAYFEDDHQVVRTIRIEITRDVIIVHDALDVVATLINDNFGTLISCKKSVLRSVRIYDLEIIIPTLPLFKLREFDVIGA